MRLPALAVLVATVAFAKPPSPAVLAKLEKNDVKPFVAKVKQVCGPTVKATVKLAAPPDAESRPYAVKDVGAFLASAANSKDLTRNSLDQVVRALEAVTKDTYGKQAVAQGLKEVVVYAAVGDGFITFENGVLTVASHIFGDGEGTSIPADLVEKTLVWGLEIDEPHVGHRVALQHRRAIETIEAKEIAPFKEKLKAFAPKTTVTVRYDPQTPAEDQYYAVKDPGPYLVRGGLTEHQLTLFTLNLILEALKSVASDEVGKAALASELKELVVLTTIGEGVLSVKDGVMTVGSHIFGDGLGSSIPSSSMEKALRDGLVVSDPDSGEKLSLGHVQAKQRIDAKHIAPFKKKVAEVLGPSVTVTAKYGPPPKDEQPVKDAAKYLVQVADSTNFSINGLDQVVAALKAQPGSKQVKSIVVYVLVGDSFATLSDGVLSVGGHAVMDGLGSFLHQDQVERALGAKR